jgi:hypothetical protein
MDNCREIRKVYIAPLEAKERCQVLRRLVDVGDESECKTVPSLDDGMRCRIIVNILIRGNLRLFISLVSAAQRLMKDAWLLILRALIGYVSFLISLGSSPPRFLASWSSDPANIVQRARSPN